MAEAAYPLESTDDGITRFASRVGYETAATFSKLFHRHHGLSPGRYRAAQRLDEGTGQAAVSGTGSRRSTAAKRKSGKR
jgi:AraC-like DNA-binding protein